jgi:DtxR family Mn-dependent transcriptional regulator
MLGRAPFGGPIRILVGEMPQQVEHMLGTELAEQIIVTSPEPAKTMTTTRK